MARTGASLSLSAFWRYYVPVDIDGDIAQRMCGSQAYCCDDACAEGVYKSGGVDGQDRLQEQAWGEARLYWAGFDLYQGV